MSAYLQVSGLNKRFGGLQALRDCSFTVGQGRITCLVGPNGAGKTTIFNAITGFLVPDTGHVEFQGRSLDGQSPQQIVRHGIARTFQNLRLFADLTARDNVLAGMQDHVGEGPLGAIFRPFHTARALAGKRDAAMAVLAHVGLEDRADALVRNLSYGEQRKLEFARALATEPKLLLLDEPVAGMNSSEKAVLMEEIRNIRDRGYGVFLIEHDMRFVMSLCDRVAVLNFGRIIAEGAPEEIRSNPEVIEAYLGRGDEAEVLP